MPTIFSAAANKSPSPRDALAGDSDLAAQRWRIGRGSVGKIVQVPPQRSQVAR
jgi:hypothetical protein